MISANIVRKYEGGRLAYYRKAADKSFWTQHWLRYLTPASYRSAERGALGGIESPISRYLPRKGRILEAGCGIGYFVHALRKLGYDVEGVEWSAETVDAVKAINADLPIRVGDVTALSVPDKHYCAYISLGVIEHRRGGPEPFLREAYRVLDDGGIAMFSVPYMSPLRKLKAWLKCYDADAGGLEFYQYAFGEEELAALLRDAGFTIVSRYPYSAYKGLKDEMPAMGWIGQLGYASKVIQRVFDSRYLSWALRPCGHMLMLICRK